MVLFFKGDIVGPVLLQQHHGGKRWKAEEAMYMPHTHNDPMEGREHYKPHTSRLAARDL